MREMDFKQLKNIVYRDTVCGDTPTEYPMVGNQQLINLGVRTFVHKSIENSSDIVSHHLIELGLKGI